ncbi:MAG: sugar transferase [bacterium]
MFFFNRLIAFIILLFLLPILLFIGLIVFVETKSFPVYLQKRGLSLTRYPFTIYKFKTIIDSAKSNDSGINIFYKEALVEYVTHFGKILRKTGLDELPQIINVLKGEMNFIGPRPLSFSDLTILLNSNPNTYLIRHNIDIKPGITGHWQVFGNRNEGLTNLLAHELYYKNNISFKLNLKIILNTFRIIILGRHSDAIITKEIKSLYKSIPKATGNS